MSKQFQIDMAHLCSLSYENENKMEEHFTNPGENSEVLKKCLTLPSFYEGKYDVQAYVCEYQNTITVIFRGTESSADILTDLKLFLVPFYLPDIPYVETPNVHQGFYLQFQAVKYDLDQHIKNLLQIKPEKELIFGGHSLGGALATLASVYFSSKYPSSRITCFTLGSPRVGDSKFTQLFNQRISHSYRYVNDNDPVPCVPTVWRFEHVKGLIWLHQDTVQQEIPVWRFYRFLKNTFLDWFGYGYNAFGDHKCLEYVYDIKKIITDDVLDTLTKKKITKKS